MQCPIIMLYRAKLHVVGLILAVFQPSFAFCGSFVGKDFSIAIGVNTLIKHCFSRKIQATKLVLLSFSHNLCKFSKIHWILAYIRHLNARKLYFTSFLVVWHNKSSTELIMQRIFNNSLLGALLCPNTCISGVYELIRAHFGHLSWKIFFEYFSKHFLGENAHLILKWAC